MNTPVTATSQGQVFRKLLRHRSATIGASIILFFVVVAIFAPLIATHDPRQANIVERLKVGQMSIISAPMVSDGTSSAGSSTAPVSL